MTSAAITPGSASNASIANVADQCDHCGLPVPKGRRGERKSNGSAFCCFGCHFAAQLSPAGDGDPGARPVNAAILRLGLGIFLTMNLMAFSGVFYSRELFASDVQHEGIAGVIAYLLMLLCTVVIVVLGVPMMADALRQSGLQTASKTGRRWRIDVNLLIGLGVFGAYVLSVIHTLGGQGSLYFDTAAVILVLVTLGHYLDAVARRRATLAVGGLLSQLPQSASIRDGDQVRQVNVDEVQVGDIVRVRAGERVPVDGCIIEGVSQVTEAALTGESLPRTVGPTDTVMAGGVNVDGLLWLRTTAVGDARVVTQIERLMADARTRQPHIQRVADRVAALFVPLVIALAVVTFAWHAWQADMSTALFVSLSVLLISCPCALGLAAPLATWSALRRAAEHGILFDSLTTLERSAGVRHVCFDKTGTLTDAQLTLAAVHPATGVTQDEALRLAASLEATSLHPLAIALVKTAEQRGLAHQPASEARTLPGIGVEGNVDGAIFRIGSARLLQEASISQDAPCDDAADSDRATIDVYLLDQRRILARFVFSETLRYSADLAIRHLKTQGQTCSVLTGDREASVRRIAQQLNVDVAWSLLPQQKIEHLEAKRREVGGPIAMVGDGINDAPVLAAADVGFATACATDLAQSAGHVRLLTDRLDRVPLALAIARHAMRRIRLNLVWAFGYNVIGLTLATAGLLNPLFAAGAMFASSLMIVLTSRGAGDVASRDSVTVEPRRVPTPHATESPAVTV